MYQTSNDYGKTWSTSIKILGYYQHGNVSKVTANPMISIKLQNNTIRWILPIWQEPHTVNDTGIGCAEVLIR